jgi:hypothetical protein
MRVVAFMLVLAGLTGAAPARAQEAAEAARAHFDRGATLAAERRYAEAALEFKASHEGDPRKEALFAWAQVERLAGNCAAAGPLYRRFLDQPDLTPAQREAAELNLGRCEEAAPQPPPLTVESPPPAPAPAVRSPAPPPALVAAPTRSRSAKLVGAALLASAGAALAGSATFWWLARNDERDAVSAPVFDEYYGPARRAHDRQRLAAGALAAGVLLGAGALLQWMLTAPPPPALTAWQDHGALGLRGRF